MDNSANPPPKAHFDPGWNDPPPLTFNGQQPNRPRNFLNKRVAFPLSGGAPSTPPMPVNMPPTATAGAPPCILSPPNISKCTNTSQECEVDRENTLHDVKSVLLEVLNNCKELGSKVNDIKRRIDVMEEMWLSEKLNNQVYVQMKNLAYALRDNEPSKADDIHRALMIEQVGAVGTWMPGVKQLIHHCIAKSELLAIEKES